MQGFLRSELLLLVLVPKIHIMQQKLQIFLSSSVMELQTRGMAWIEGDLLPQAGLPPAPDQASQGPIQPGLEYFQGWGIQTYSGQCVPVRHHSLSKIFPPNNDFESPIIYFKNKPLCKNTNLFPLFDTICCCQEQFGCGNYQQLNRSYNFSRCRLLKDHCLPSSLQQCNSFQSAPDKCGFQIFEVSNVCACAVIPFTAKVLFTQNGV